MTQVVAQNFNTMMRYREKIFIFLVSSIVCLALSYAFFLHSAIVNVVERESVLKENRVLSTKVSELEAKYFSLKNDINIALAHEKGFKDSGVAGYISVKSLTAMASPNEL
jgi:type II secretory pathway component PulM